MNETYKQLILEKYTECPYYGRPKLTAHLRGMGHKVNHKRVYTIMKGFRISAIYAKPNTSVANVQNTVYPYLLKDIRIYRLTGPIRSGVRISRIYGSREVSCIWSPLWIGIVGMY